MGSAVSPRLSRLRGLLLMAPLLGAAACVGLAAAAAAEEPMLFDVLRDGSKIGEHRMVFEQEDGALKVSVATAITVDFAFEIGRASCRQRVCMSVKISVVARYIKKKQFISVEP